MKKRIPSAWIKATGEAIEIFPLGKKWKPEEITKCVGGYFEIIHRTNLPPGKIMLVNEDGLLMKLPENLKASLIAGRLIVGDVLIVNAKEIE